MYDLELKLINLEKPRLYFTDATQDLLCQALGIPSDMFGPGEELVGVKGNDLFYLKKEFNKVYKKSWKKMK